MTSLPRLVAREGMPPVAILPMIRSAHRKLDVIYVGTQYVINSPIGLVTLSVAVP